MMAVLVGGQRFSLASKKNHSKCVVYVKLTDSSLKALEEYLKNNKNESSRQKPTIQFLNGQNTGKICIPNDERSVSYTFSISSNEEAQGPQGSFECLHIKKPSSTLESLGTLSQKLTVNAKEHDAYQRFEKKMVEAKKESEKRTTQILDRNGISSKVSSKISRSQLSKINSGGSRPTSEYRSALSPSSGNNSLAPNHPILDRNKNKVGSGGNPDIMRRPLKERIIHHLAVRPYKKPELFNKIQRDGLRERDRKCITVILKQVSFMKENTYNLLRHLWTDVSEDWPFYSEQDRQSFRRRKPQNLTPPGSDGSSCSSGHSPSSTTPASPSALKRPPNFYESESNGKRKRVSNFVRPVNELLESRGSEEVKEQLLSSSEASSVNSLSQTSSVVKTSNWLLQDSSSSSSSSSITNPYSNKPHDDFLSTFKSIQNKDQRALYKIEFNSNYKRYRELHASIEKVSKRFAQLEERLLEISKKSGNPDAIQRMKEIIARDYENTNNDPSYVNNRFELLYLHEKLAHIKKLVSDYDEAKLLSLSRQSVSGLSNLS